MNKPQEKKANRTVRDDHGVEYELIQKIGEGGQGVVCRTRYPNVLVKVSRRPLSEPKVKDWFEHVRWIARQPLAGMHIATPVAFINSELNPGYVMELMDGLEPLGKMLEQSMLALQEGRGAEEYRATGGVSRRVRVLAKLARILADLHGRALVYGDLSPSNIFVSKAIGYHEVWLIDCDNISVLSRVGRQKKIWSPDFGAPEIVRGESGINSLSDSWSFGVLAFLMLTLVHPFEGDLIIDGEPELKAKADCGEFPWIDHPTDDRNRSTKGLPRDQVLSLRLRNLFEQCFNAGLVDPGERPSMAAWAEAFEAAEMLLVDCDAGQGCGSSFIFNPRAECPFCGYVLTADSCILMRQYVFAPLSELGEGASPRDQWMPTDDLQLVRKLHDVELHSSPVGTARYAESSVICKLLLDERGLLVTPTSSVPITVVGSNGSGEHKLRKPFLLPADSKRDSWISLHIGDPKTLHAVWRFKW